MAQTEAQKKHIEALKNMSTAQVIMTLIESLAGGMNRYTFDLAELEERFKKIEKDNG